MRVAKTNSAARSNTATLENSLGAAQIQPVRDGEPISSFAVAQMLDTMQQQGWRITCPSDSLTPSRVGAIMVGKLSRHAT